MDFHSKITRIHTKSRKLTRFEPLCLVGAFKTMRKNDEICETPLKSTKILDAYVTNFKIDEKSRFEHAQITLCEKA